MNETSTKKYWFKRRRYGYGWVPVTWQGWFVVLGFIGGILLGALFLKKSPGHTISSDDLVYVAFVVLAVIALVLIALKKGPQPKWRWGKDHKDNSDEDF